MSFIGNVQQKISCVFETAVLPNTSSLKRSEQTYKVVASDRLRENVSVALMADNCGSSDTGNYVATEKLDGTCVFINEFRGNAWLWARHDRKPNKAAEKRFRKFQNQYPQSLLGEEGFGDGIDKITFHWDVGNDFKDVPADWIPATNMVSDDGTLLPDASGHIPGWVPVDITSKQHCWHLSTVDLDCGVALVLMPNRSKPGHLEIMLQPFAELSGSTMELIGTNVNGNPYRLGSKSKPLHLLVRHGIIPAENVPPADFAGLKDWFQSPDGGVEGIVWHFSNNKMYKLHRHHMDLNWPVENLKLLSFPVTVNIDKDDQTCYASKLLSDMVNISGHIFKSLDKLW